MVLDIKLGFQTTLGHPKCHFPAIYRFSGQYRPLWRKSIFWSEKYPKSPCADFFIFYHMEPYFAPYGPKFEICLEMCSPGPKDTSKSPECHYSIPEFDFIEISKILFFTNFTCIWPFWWKLSKIVIFWCLKKYHLDIKSLHPRYLEVSLGPGEHISRHISNFGPHAAKYGSIW